MAVDYSEYQGKKVTLSYNNLDPQDGLIEAGSAIGVVFKPKGTSTPVLVEADSIQDIELIKPGPKKLKQRIIKQVTEGKFREHLIDKHGYTISDISPMSDDEARVFHEGIDHSDLGHQHRELTEAEKAIKEEEQGASEETEETEDAENV